MRWHGMAAVLFLTLGLNPSAAWAENATVARSPGVTVHSHPSYQSVGTTFIKVNNSVEIISKDVKSGFTMIRTTNGQEGWVADKFLKKSATAAASVEASKNTQNVEANGVLSNSLVQSVASWVQGAEPSKLAASASTPAISTKLGASSAEATSTASANSENPTNLEKENGLLRQENLQLHAGQLQWFMIGASVMFAGFLLGFLTGKEKWRRRYSWGASQIR